MAKFVILLSSAFFFKSKLSYFHQINGETIDFCQMYEEIAMFLKVCIENKPKEILHHLHWPYSISTTMPSRERVVSCCC